MHDPFTGLPSDHAVASATPRRRAKRFLAGLGLIVLLGAAAYVSTLPLGGARAASPAPGEDIGAISGAVEGLGIGQSAPDFVGADGTEPLLADLDGRPIRLDDYAGKPLWIVFWATWCTPCQQEATDIRDAYHAHRDDGLGVLAIDIQEPAAAVRAYVIAHDLDYPIGLDPTAAVKDLYGGSGLPFHVFLDGNGVIRDRYIGQMTATLMEQHLRAIIGS